jgi:hypothetical protein
MKKLVLTTVCALAVTGAAFAQGNVSWATPFSSITAQTNSTTYSPLLGGGSAAGGAVGLTGGAITTGLGYDYELLYTTYSGAGALPTIPSLASLLAWNDTQLGATNGTVAGRLTPIAPNTQATVPWAAGVTDSIVLVGWSADLGSSWSSVSNLLAAAAAGNKAPLQAQLAGQLGFFGISTTGFITGNSANPGNSVFSTAPVANVGTPIFSLLTPLYLVPVPEPTTLALAGLGGLSLLLFRRQRK